MPGLVPLTPSACDTNKLKDGNAMSPFCVDRGMAKGLIDSSSMLQNFMSNKLHGHSNSKQASKVLQEA